MGRLKKRCGRDLDTRAKFTDRENSSSTCGGSESFNTALGAFSLASFLAFVLFFFSPFSESASVESIYFSACNIVIH